MESAPSKLRIVSEKTKTHCAVYENEKDNKKYDANIDQFYSGDYYYYDESSIPDFFIKQVYFGRSLKSPAILPVYDFNLQNSIIFTKHMTNGTLDNLLAKNLSTVSGTTKYIILLGISLGMKYLHSCDILHLGLSPDHIYLDENHYPKISGFMFSEHTKSATLSQYQGSFSEKSIMITMLPPTVYFYQTAPELRDGTIVTHKFDVFSFALIAYQLLAKSELKTDDKKKYSIRSISRVESRPDLDCIDDDQVKDLVSHMWDKNPIYRPDFNEITDEIQKDYFIRYFNADKQKVDEYIALFEKKDEEEDDDE